MKITFIATLLITAVNLHLATPTRAAEDYVAHEWGTITSVQGAEGVQLAWNPFITSELAAFVYDPYKQNAEQITGYSTGAAAARPQIVEATRGLDLGRFLQPVFHRVTSVKTDAAFKKISAQLMQLVSQPFPVAKPFASVR